MQAQIAFLSLLLFGLSNSSQGAEEHCMVRTIPFELIAFNRNPGNEEQVIINKPTGRASQLPSFRVVKINPPAQIETGWCA
jgi:hypothetical protein